MSRARDLADGAANVFTASNKVKLGGIEAAATADQTNTEIRTAVEAASDSNVFTDADHSKLNGIEASADVTDTTNVAAAGALMTHVSGTERYTFGGLNGNSKFVIEASSSAGGGAGGAFLKFRGSNGTPVDIAAIDGSMTNGSSGSESGELYFYTKNSGTLINAMTVKNNDSVFIKGKLDVGSIGASGGATGEVAFGGISGSIDGFRIHNTGGNYLELRAASSGNAVRMTNTGMMGIGKTPNDKLDIHSGDIRIQNADQTFADHSQAQGIQWTQETDADVARIEASRHTWGHAPHNLNFYTRDDSSDIQKRLIIDYKGRVTTPYQPSFHVAKSDGTWTSVAIFNNVYHNVGSHYSTETGVFTSPVNGYYQFNVNVMLNNNNSASTYFYSLQRNGASYAHAYSYAPASQYIHLPLAMRMYLAAGDLVRVKGQSGDFYGSASPHCNFSGALIG